MTISFTMHGARVAIDDGLLHIEEQISAIESCVVENPGLTFDLAKTVVESTCKTILAHRNIAFEPADKLPTLFKLVTTNLPLLPEAASGEIGARNSLKQTLNALHTTLQGVCALRNSHGFASHGGGGLKQSLEPVHALLAAQAADAIVGFLHKVHCEARAPVEGQLGYGDNEAFNAYADDVNEVIRIFDMEYRPSEVLFNVDMEAYRNHLAGFALGEEEPSETNEG